MEAAVTIGLVAIIGLALFDLWVGVANDAVNFLNSAIGSRAASRRAIMAIAAGGIAFGALTSSGLMEVARKGVFDPDRFTDPETGTVIVLSILAVYLGVMAADVLLLDLFNTFGLPTSTTVSIISELVGASIAVALWTTPGGFGQALTVIQTGPVLGIYTGIFLSVLVAFTSSALIMFLVRLFFTHDVPRTFPRIGWVWTGLSFAALIYFVLFKGLTNTRLLPPEVAEFISANPAKVVALAFLPAGLVGLLMRHEHERVLKLIILLGTGSLGLAFAGNDLVNFIGPSVAAAQAVLVEGIRLSGSVPTPTWALLLAGVVMVASLWSSKKARRVTDTEVRLAAHGATEQRFRENGLARALVKWARGILKVVKAVTPGWLEDRVNRRTEPPPPTADQPPYDLLRATVNLSVAALLISIGTANKLPLSTTYITFMAAMGAALGDRVWRWQDAEKRLAGILMVLGGWLITGFLAASGAFVMASLIVLGGSWGVFLAVGAVAFGLIRMKLVNGSDDDEGPPAGSGRPPMDRQTSRRWASSRPSTPTRAGARG
jgi:phosphate/sulfate permease